MNGYKIVLLKAIFMLYRLPESERVCSGICSLPSDSFYHAIDSLTLIKESGWSKDANNKYTYQMVWDAKDSPNGDDLFLTIEIEKGSRFGHMRFGAW